MGQDTVGDEQAKACSGEGWLLLKRPDVERRLANRRKRITKARQGLTAADLTAIERAAKRAKAALGEYKEIKRSEIHSFLFHFDLLWEGCGYLPKHVSEAMDAIQKAVATNRGILEGYMGNAQAHQTPEATAKGGMVPPDVGNSGKE